MALSALDDESIAFVFPFRRESLNMLEWVGANHPSWKSEISNGTESDGTCTNGKGYSNF